MFRCPCSTCGKPFDLSRIDRSLCIGCRTVNHNSSQARKYRKEHPMDPLRNPSKRRVYLLMRSGVLTPNKVAHEMKMSKSAVHYHVKNLIKEGFIKTEGYNLYSVSNEFQRVKELLSNKPITN